MWGDGGPYAAWTTYLERWQADLGTREEPLPPLGRDDYAPQTWVRLTNHIIDAINGRLRLWSDALSADISASRTEFAVGQALVNARTGLASVVRLVDHPSLPEDLREQLRAMVEAHVKSMQQTLEQDVQGLVNQGWPRAEADARMRTVTGNPLTAVLTAPPVPAAPAPGEPSTNGTPDPWAFDPTSRPRRRLVID